MSNHAPMAFLPDGVTIPLGNILPLKVLPVGIQSSRRYLRIKASMQEVGIVEPPIVFPQKGKAGTYLMLDGHVRLDIAKALGHSTMFCYVAVDDEAFTYNHKVSQLMPIQEHFMVLKAIKNGVSEERIARTLNVDPAAIRQKRDLLAGICPEAVELLKDRRASAGAIREMKRAKPMRQIEMAELMVASNNYTTAYARCLVIASPQNQIVETADGDKGMKNHGLEPRDVARIQSEMTGLERDFKMVQDEYGQNMLHLVVVVAYIRRLLDKAAVVRYLSRVEPAMLAEFQRIVETSDLRATG
ncbi:MAG: ParB N-terminal domain-containing protein [Planctomycetes bacterium]|nr:ParB N-terminal domain-containing protein [Planctomycetota bacterium]